MSKIAVVGAGRVGSTLAAGLAKAGHAVTLGVRRVDQARDSWKGPPVGLSDVAQAVRGAEIVVNALPGDVSVDILPDLKSDLSGKVLIDVANATRRAPNGAPGGLLYPDGSLGQTLQEALPDTQVVKALNTMAFMVMANPTILSGPATVFMSGNSGEAKATVRGLLKDLGWPNDAIEDLGGIESARATEALILLIPYLVKSRGFAPFAVSVAR